MPVQTNTPLPSSTLQSHFHPHFPFFSFLLPPGAAFRPSHYLISVSPVGSGGLHSFILFAPSAEKNPLFPCCSVQRLLLPPSSKNWESRAGATTCDVEKNKTQEEVSFSAKDLPRKHLGEADPRVWQEQDAEMKEENGQ